MRRISKQGVSTWIAGMLMGIVTASAQLPPTSHPLPVQLANNNRELFDESMSLFDASFDTQAGLVRRPADSYSLATAHPGKSPRITLNYMVRESGWYALGLLIRDRAGDRPADAQRAIDILNKVIDQQYLNPNNKWYGTFKRSPEEQWPEAKDASFTSYDPNWRHFIGTTFEMILIEYPERIPASLKERMYRSIHIAVDGEIHDGRLVPSYSNIALMYGSLWDFAAIHEGNRVWLDRSTAWTNEVFRLYKQYGTFNEFNAPTYYGVDLYGLGLWREYGSTQHIRDMGRTMEQGLWRDIANFYNPGMRNIAGPYDRAYGMDMANYVTPTGLWLRSVMPRQTAPLPQHPTLTTDHVADIWYAPQIVLLGADIPADAMARFTKFSGPHFINRTISANRRSTTWVGERAIWGAEFTSRTKDTGNRTQFHPVTAQWEMPFGQVGWLKLTHSPNIDAIADRSGVSITTDGTVSFRIFAGKTKLILAQKLWTLPGFKVEVDGDVANFSYKPAPDFVGCVDVTYTGVKSLRLNFSPTSNDQTDQ